MPNLQNLLGNPWIAVALTIVIFFAACRLRGLCSIPLLRPLLNPVLITVALIIAILSAFQVDYATYSEGGKMIEFWLKPAVVALGVPLYRQLETIRRQMLPVIAAELAGCVAGILSVVLVARLFGAADNIILSLVPKAVTTPIAIEISNAIGGITPLTAAVVVCTGILGNMAGFTMVSMSRIKSPIAGSLSIGTATHAVGTAAAMERSERFGAYSSLGLTLNGILTALLTPLLLPLLGY